MVPELRLAFHVDLAEHGGLSCSVLITVRSVIALREVTLWIVLDFLAGALGLDYSNPSRSSQIKELHFIFLDDKNYPLFKSQAPFGLPHSFLRQFRGLARQSIHPAYRNLFEGFVLTNALKYNKLSGGRGYQDTLNVYTDRSRPGLTH